MQVQLENLGRVIFAVTKEMVCAKVQLEFELGCVYLKKMGYNPFRTAVSFWGQFGTNYLGFDWCVPKTGLEF